MEYKNLVFEGGVVLGIAYGGALKALEEKNILQNIKRAGGSSAGAITALLVALGYSADEFTTEIKTTDFNLFVKDNPFIIFTMVDNYGIHSGKNLKKWVEKIIYKKTGEKVLTFGEHHSLVLKNKAFKDLYLIGTNLNCSIEGIYSYETCPDMNISEAIRVSMSVPFYFQAFKQSCDGCKQDKVYLCKPDNIEDECVLIDGGCLWNYPVDVFDNKKYLVDPSNYLPVKYIPYPEVIYNKETLGFRLGTKDELQYKLQNRNIRTPIKGIGDYSKMLIELWLEKSNKLHLHKNDWARTIFIDTGTVDAFKFNLSPEEKNTLITNGYNGVEKYFKWRDNIDIVEYLTKEPELTH